MSTPSIDKRFLEPLESMGLSLETADVPMLIFVGTGLDDYADQVSAVLGGTVIYTSQSDFEQQVLASVPHAAYLFVVIDKPLAGRPFDLVHAYLRARDVMGADPSGLLKQFKSRPLHAQHRLILLLDRATLMAHAPEPQRILQELSTRIVVR